MDASNEQLDRLNLLYQKLKSSQGHEATGAKLKLRNIQSIIVKFYSEIEQMNMDRDSRLELLNDRLYRVQTSIQDESTKREVKEKALSARIAKIQKNYKKAVEAVVKERGELDKKVQSCIEACLADITGHKNKQQNDGGLIVKEMAALIPEVQELQQQVEGESVITKEILKKIYNQFSQQIDQLKEMIEEQRLDRQAEQQALLKRLEETYLGIHNSILSVKKSREKSEKMLVDLLERVIEKVKRQLSGID